MVSFRNLPVRLFVVGLSLAQLSGCGRAKEPKKDSAGEKTEGAAPAPAEVKNAGAKPDVKSDKDRLDLPVPKGQPQRGLRIPIFSPDGKLTMSFQIGVAEAVDADNIKMGDLRLETFKENGEHEFDVDLPDSVFNSKTKELTSKVRVTVKRRDFEITGNSAVFNIETKTGRFADGVKMVIYDARASAAESEQKPEIPAAEIKPLQEEKK
jgi:hypothetical protein